MLLNEENVSSCDWYLYTTVYTCTYTFVYTTGATGLQVFGMKLFGMAYFYRFQKKFTI